MEILKPRGSHVTVARPESIAPAQGFSFGYDMAVVITHASPTVRRAAQTRPPRPTPLGPAVQRPRLANLSVSPLARSDAGMTEPDRIDALHSGTAAAGLVEDDADCCTSDGDPT
jgi:hypothetical protein